MWIGKEKKRKSGNRSKYVGRGGEYERITQPECLSNKGRKMKKDEWKRKLTRWAMESVGKKRTLRTDETEK